VRLAEAPNLHNDELFSDLCATLSPMRVFPPKDRAVH
jgi:hypothetical protein